MSVAESSPFLSITLGDWEGILVFHLHLELKVLNLQVLSLAPMRSLGPREWQPHIPRNMGWGSDFSSLEEFSNRGMTDNYLLYQGVKLAWF